MIYLGGPYTSATLENHKLNIGRLLSYKIWIYIDTDEQDLPVICWPLETAGFDYGQRLTYMPWLHMAMEIAKYCSMAAFVPGWQSSEGSKKEVAMFERLGVPVKLLPRMSLDTIKRVRTELYKMGRHCHYGTWAKAYLKQVENGNA
jgi:hypothetical protein